MLEIYLKTVKESNKLGFLSKQLFNENFLSYLAMLKSQLCDIYKLKKLQQKCRYLSSVAIFKKKPIKIKL